MIALALEADPSNQELIQLKVQRRNYSQIAIFNFLELGAIPREIDIQICSEK